MTILFMHDNRRHFRRGKIPGVALIDNGGVKGTSIIDIGVGGMRIFTKTLVSRTAPVSVELKFLHPKYRIAFSKPTKAQLVHSEINSRIGGYALGFRFLDLTPAQQRIIASELSPKRSVHSELN